MHIDETTHQHARTSKVYTYSADYAVDGQNITWTARARQGDAPGRELSGSIPVTSPGVAAMAEQAVRDAVVMRIDALQDN